MENLIYILPIIVIIYIVYIIVKYTGIEKYEKTHIEYYRDRNFTELPPLAWSYIIDKKFKKESIIATILLYVKKGHIMMTKKNKEYEFKIVKSIDEINELDLWAINLFFRGKTRLKNRQYLSNFNRYIWIEKTFGKFKQFQNKSSDVIKEYLSKTDVIDYVDEKLNKNNIIFSYIVIIITLFISTMYSAEFGTSLILSIFFMVGYSLLIVMIEKSQLVLLAHGTIFFGVYFGIGGWNIYSLFLIITSLLTLILIYIDDKLLRVQGKNGEVIEKALGLKRYIRDFSNIKKYSLEHVHIWDEYYIYSIALGINKVVL